MAWRRETIRRIANVRSGALRAGLLLLLCSPTLAADSAWQLPRVELSRPPQRVLRDPPDPDCFRWDNLREFVWYNGIYDLAWVPGKATVWAVGGSTYDPNGTWEDTTPIVCTSSDGGYNWRIQQGEFAPSSISDGFLSLYKVQFLNDRIGWAAGGVTGSEVTAAVVYRTTDAGETWALVYEGPPGALYPRHAITDFVFVDGVSGWAVGAIDAIHNVAIIHTADSGDTWTAQATGFDAAVLQVDFPDPMTGYAAANLGHVLTSVDGGEHWAIVGNTGISNGPLAMQFGSASEGLMTSIGSMILRTTDDGATWTVVYDAPRRLWGLDYADPTNVWAVGEYGTIVRSQDGGGTWQLTPSQGDLQNLLACAARGAESVWMTGLGTVGYTQDGGATWHHVDGDGYITSAFLQDIAFTDDANGWAAGFHGELVHTADGGLTWKHHYGVTTNISAIDFVGSQFGWLAGADAVWQTQDAGATWRLQATLAQALIDIQFVDEEHGWASGTFGALYRTDDGGDTWEPLVTGTSEGLYAISFVDDQTGWVVGWNGTVLHTKDGGDHWLPQQVPTPEPLYSVSFVDALTGWIAGLHTIYATTDGGTSWVIQHVDSGYQLASVHFVDHRRGIAVGGIVGVCRILVTSDGGSTWEACGVNQEGDSLNLGQKLQDVQLLESGVAYAAGQLGWVIKLNPDLTAVPDVLSSPTSALVVLSSLPNPTRGATELRFRLAAPSDVGVDIFDVTGRRVFGDRIAGLSAGEHAYRYHGLTTGRVRLPAGVYFQRVTALGVSKTAKLVILR